MPGGGRPSALCLEWSEEALTMLGGLAEWKPAACRRAVAEMERMARAGFNYGRGVEPGRWYWPAGDVGVFYGATASTLRVRAVVDAKRLRELP